jgi:outer membrane protein TolC
MMRHIAGAQTWRVAILCVLVSMTAAVPGNAQVRSQDLAVSTQSPAQPGGAGQTPSNAPLVLTLQDALQRARSNSPQFQSALTDLGVAREERVQSRAGLLPNVNYTTQVLYTQPAQAAGQTALGIPVRFIANNFPHEYVAQGIVHQVISPGLVAEYRRTGALVALAKAKAEIAARGLVVTVVQAYYGYVVAQRKYATEQRAATEAQHFFEISQKLERGGEVAHSDVIKAQIQYQQQQRDFQEAQLGMDKARLGLAVLLFPDFNENFSIIDDLRLPAPLPTFAEVSAAATKNNPEIRAAVASLRAAGQDVAVAWAGVLPSISGDYFYGIDAPRFATYSTDPVSGQRFKNLGYSWAITLDLPIWNWGSNYSKVKQARLVRRQAQVELSAAQRQFLADLRSFYSEAQIARTELESLSSSADLAAESLRLTTLRYQGGEATVLEVVDAQNTLTQAQNAYDDGQVRFRLAIANLQTLTGTL